MLCRLLRQNLAYHRPYNLIRRLASDDSASKDESALNQDLNLTGIHLDEIDQIMIDGAFDPLEEHYPNIALAPREDRRPFKGHNVMVIQPWIAYTNTHYDTDPDLQLEECVSLANTVTGWNVVDKRLVFANSINRKQLLKPKAFEELQETIRATPGVSAILFGVELLSAIQRGTLEKSLKLAVYDRFTTVLNIFRQHARTKEAKIQLALAELPYIKAHLREIHESSEYSASAESIKTLVGGSGEVFYKKRLEILKRREVKLRYLLEELKRQREVTKRSRKKQVDIPLVSIVGYTNSGKTTLIKYLTQDEKLQPKDQLFATLDVSVHLGTLPSNRQVFYLDTVGFISRIPMLLVEAFSATLKDVQESNLIVHVLDVSHPDHKIQYQTVVKALESLKVSRQLLDTKITIGNKVDKLNSSAAKLQDKLPDCDLRISATKGDNMDELVEMINTQLLSNMKHERLTLRVDNGGKKYVWLRKHTTITECHADETDPNFLLCDCVFGPAALGRWKKQFGSEDIIRSHGRVQSLPSIKYDGIDRASPPDS